MDPHPSSPVILVTGASSGIGEATARLFARQGYRVVAAARRMDRLQQLAAEIQEAGGEALPVRCDVSQLDDIQRLVDQSLDRYGQIDVLFNNAGFGRLDWLEKLDPRADIVPQIDVNLTGVILTAQAVLPHMLGRRSGVIVNMGSVASLIAVPTYSIYAASKFGVRGFTEALRREVLSSGVQVCGIYPGGVVTEFSQHARPRRNTGLRTPSILRLEADDVADAVWRLVRHPRRMMVLPWPMKVAAWIAALFPGFTDWVLAERFVKREKGG